MPLSDVAAKRIFAGFQGCYVVCPLHTNRSAAAAPQRRSAAGEVGGEVLKTT